MTMFRLALVALAALRVTRFFTSDSLGEWWVAGPAKRWAWRREATTDPAVLAQLEEVFERDLRDGKPQETPSAQYGWRSKLVSGLDCPFCVGFWAGVLVLLGDVVTRRVRPLRGLWTFALGALALNYATGHVSSRLDG